MPYSDIVCPHCDPFVRKWKYTHRVVERDGIATCEGCGGVLKDGAWTYQCRKCDKTVEPGQLRGLFVPHLCAPCEQAETDSHKARGAVCGMCHETYNRCCC